MAITNEFMKAVQDGNIMLVRIMMKDILVIDPTCVKFGEMERYAAERMDGLYLPHDGEPLDFDVAAWTVNYLNRQMVLVVNNFSKERLELLKSMVRHIYQDKAREIEAGRDAAHRHKPSDGISQRQVGMGLGAVGAVAAIAGLCASQTVVAAAGGAAVVGGIILIAADKGNG